MNKRLLIPIMEIDSAWCLRGFSHSQYAQEYCVKILKIPIKYIVKSDLSRSGLNVEIEEIEGLSTEVWYGNLLSLSKV
ncbi:MAG TPA: hypothetical protein EYG94_03765 [Campylobacterales bacterium]|nr:hypothetical protein [Campylobacterales bacterium]